MFAHTEQAMSNSPNDGASAEADHVRAAAGSRHLRVLVADDDPDFRSTLVAALKRLGLRVSVVGDGNALISALASAANDNAPDLVITDNHMPGCNGLTALQVMQESGLTTPTILITGFCDEATQTAAHDYGAVAVLQKPVDLAELRAMINAALT